MKGNRMSKAGFYTIDKSFFNGTINGTELKELKIDDRIEMFIRDDGVVELNITEPDYGNEIYVILPVVAPEGAEIDSRGYWMDDKGEYWNAPRDGECTKCGVITKPCKHHPDFEDDEEYTAEEMRDAMYEALKDTHPDGTWSKSVNLTWTPDFVDDGLHQGFSVEEWIGFMDYSDDYSDSTRVKLDKGYQSAKRLRDNDPEAYGKMHSEELVGDMFVDDGKHLGYSTDEWYEVKMSRPRGAKDEDNYHFVMRRYEMNDPKHKSFHMTFLEIDEAYASAKRRYEHLDNHSTECKHTGWMSMHPNTNDGELTCDDCGVKITGGSDV